MSENRTKISLKLTPEASNALGGEKYATLDLAPGFSFRLSKSVEELTDVNEINTEGVLPFSVPFSKNNDFALLPFTSPAIVDNPMEGIEARAFTDGYQLNFDKVYFRRKNDAARQWELEFRRSPDHWLERASNKMLCTIDCGTATLDESTVTDSWANPVWADGESPAVWPILDYGGWVDLAEPIQFTDPPAKSVWLEDLRPLFSLPYLLKQGFCEIGWNLQGLILETEWFASLWVYILSREYFTESRGEDFRLVGSNMTTDVVVVPPAGSPIRFNTVDQDSGANAVPYPIVPGFYIGGLTNPLPYKNKWTFCFSGFIENSSTQQPFAIGVFEIDESTGFPTGLVINEENTFRSALGSSEVKYFNICVDVELEVGQCASLWIAAPTANITLKAGYRVNVYANQQSLMRGDTVDLKRLISCEENYTLLNLFKATCHLLNLRIDTDFDTRTLTVYPKKTADVYGDTTPGFVNDGGGIVIDEKVICDSAKISPIKNTLTRFTRYQFADSTDAYIEETDPIEPPFSRKILNGIELQDRITELRNPFFEPTLEGQSDVLKRQSDPDSEALDYQPYLPRLWDNTTGERSFNIAPRIFFNFGSVAQKPPESGALASAKLYFEGSVIDTFGYVSQQRTWDFVSVTPPHLDGNVVFGTLPDDLYVLFYLGDALAKRRGSLIDILVWMDATDYKNWNFREPLFFSYEGIPVRAELQAIRDFAPATDLPTPIEMLVAPLMTECCDLPCSCRFEACEYWQDFGQFMSQTTLDTLEITSFVVNGVEQLSAPVDFGVINVVEINGKPFVTNLVDALNGIGLDYFSFQPTATDYPEKDDVRFFQIKRPACWSFRIEISDGVEVVYFYSEAAMGSKWFSGGDFEPFGYAENAVSEPQNCVVTVEY